MDIQSKALIIEDTDRRPVLSACPILRALRSLEVTTVHMFDLTQQDQPARYHRVELEAQYPETDRPVTLLEALLQKGPRIIPPQFIGWLGVASAFYHSIIRA